jgi:hypothetical protein
VSSSSLLLLPSTLYVAAFFVDVLHGSLKANTIVVAGRGLVITMIDLIILSIRTHGKDLL